MKTFVASALATAAFGKICRQSTIDACMDTCSSEYAAWGNYKNCMTGLGCWSAIDWSYTDPKICVPEPEPVLENLNICT